MTLAVGLAIALLSLFVAGAIARSTAVAQSFATRTAHAVLVTTLALGSFVAVVEVLAWMELFGWRDVVNPISEASLLAIIATTLAIWNLRKRRKAPPFASVSSVISLRALDRPAQLALASVAALLGITFITTISQFPRGFEGNAYHLPMAVHILRDHSLLPWDNYFPHTFPALASVFQGTFLYALPEKLASSTNFLFAPLLLAGSYGTCRNMGADRSIAVLAACGILSIPVIAFGLFEAEADVIALTFTCSALFFATGGTRSVRLGACLAGILCGIAYGAKPSTLAASLAIGLMVTFQPRADLPYPGGLAQRAFVAAIFGASFLALSGYWFARPWLLYGNPLYPVGLPVFERWFGWPVSEGFALAATGKSQFWYVRTPLEWFVYPWVEFEHTDQSFTAHAGYGAFVAAILIPCYFFAGLHMIRARPLDPRLLRMWLAVLLVLVGWAAVVREARYLMPVFAFLVPIGAYVIQQTPSKPRAVIKWLAVTTLLFMNFATVARELIGFGDRIVYSKMTERHLFYEYPKVIDALPDNAVIVNLSQRTAHYPLLGARLLNNVVSTPATRAALGLPATMGPVPDAHFTAAELKKLGAQYIYTEGNVTTEGCVALNEIGRLDRNPVNNTPLPHVRRLLEVGNCPSAAARSSDIGGTAGDNPP